jgi:hypothetical protein
VPGQKQNDFVAVGIISDSIGFWQACGDLVASVRAITTGREESVHVGGEHPQDVAATGDSAAGADMRARNGDCSPSYRGVVMSIRFHVSNRSE